MAREEEPEEVKCVVRCFSEETADDAIQHIKNRFRRELKVSRMKVGNEMIYSDIAEIQAVLDLVYEGKIIDDEDVPKGVEIPDVIIIVESEGSDDRVWLYAHEKLGEYYEFIEYGPKDGFVDGEVSEKRMKIFEEKHKPMLTEIMVAAKERARRKSVKEGIKSISQIVQDMADKPTYYEFPDSDWIKMWKIIKSIKGNVNVMKKNYYSKYRDECKYPDTEFDRESDDYSNEDEGN